MLLLMFCIKRYLNSLYYKILLQKNFKRYDFLSNGKCRCLLTNKSDLKSLGFKFINSETNEGTTFFNYKKGNIEVALASTFEQNRNGKGLTEYEISVSTFK